MVASQRLPAELVDKLPSPLPAPILEGSDCYPLGGMPLGAKDTHPHLQHPSVILCIQQ